MAILSVWIISKSGGLVWQKDFSQGGSSVFSLPRLSTNDYLVFASTFQSIHAITAQLDPLERKSSGIQSIDWKGFNLARLTAAEPFDASSVPAPANTLGPVASPPFRIACFQSPTGLKLLLLASPRQPQIDFVLKRLHEIYADYVLKNPFHTLEMPIRSERFDLAVGKLVEQMTSAVY